MTKVFDYDGLLYAKEADCRTCEKQKPARSKHCSVCDKCVMKFDHHCVWINQCVGYYNYKWFLSFIFLHAVLATYLLVLGVGIFLHLAEERNLYPGYNIKKRSKKQVPLDFSAIQKSFKSLIATER